jgi:prepilin-type N-terminal cleavage/methylation domain-containing protein
MLIGQSKYYGNRLQDCRMDPGETSHKRGFSLLELIIAVTIIMILAAVTAPKMISVISDIKLRYSATDLAGLLQTCRMQAVRKNTFYGVQPIPLPQGNTGYFVNLNGVAYAAGDPLVVLGTATVISQGAGSGAPNEAAFLAGLGFVTVAGAVVPSFNARGLPCVPFGNTCPQIPGQGFVLFLQRTTAVGSARWAAVVVNASGRVQVWSCDTQGNWLQR